jgi:hypothetical protein
MRDDTDLSQPSTNGTPSLTCEEFQERLPGLIGGEIRDHEHLQSCVRCNALLEELEYIAEMAKGLLPSYEPSDKVWQQITKSIREPEDADHPSN